MDTVSETGLTLASTKSCIQTGIASSESD